MSGRDKEVKVQLEVGYRQVQPVTIMTDVIGNLLKGFSQTHEFNPIIDFRGGRQDILESCQEVPDGYVGVFQAQKQLSFISELVAFNFLLQSQRGSKTEREISDSYLEF